METNPQAFRRQVIDAVIAIQAQRPDGFLHLVYSPELADPLQLLEESRRETAPIRPANLPQEWKDVDFPRLVTLDCRRVAAFMLETDPARDDPLFESSITQAHAEIFLGEMADIGVINENPGPPAGAVCGWIASGQSAAELARRMAKHSHPLRPGSYHYWIRWHNPIHLSALWPALSPAQQRALLGDAIWIAHDPIGELRTYAADQTGAVAGEAEVNFRPNDEQWARYDNAPAAVRLIRRWQNECAEEGTALPPDALERLHRHLAETRRLRLRGDERAIYAMILARLPAHAARAAEWHALVERAGRGEGTLREGLASLPEYFWNPDLPEPAHARPARP
jgi:hypothetical protein